jgi:hypothetical protein
MRAMTLPGYLSEVDGATLVSVPAQPRAGRDEIAGERVPGVSADDAAARLR